MKLCVLRFFWAHLPVHYVYFNNDEEHIEFALYHLSPLCHIIPRFAVWEGKYYIHIHYINKLYIEFDILIA